MGQADKECGTPELPGDQPRAARVRRMRVRLRHLVEQSVVQLMIFSIGFVGLLLALTTRLDYNSAWAFGDHFAFPTSAYQEWSTFAYGWNWTSIGLAGSGGTLQGVLLSPVVTNSPFDGILLVGCLVIGGSSMFWFLRRFFPPSSAAVAAIWYGINPVTVATFAGGSAGIDSGYLELYALFPIFLGLLLPKLADDRRVFTPSLVAVGIALGLAGTDLPALFWMYGLPVAVLIALGVIVSDCSLSRLLTRIVLVLGVALPFLLLSFNIYGSVSANPAAFTSYAASSAGFIYGPANPLNLLRGAGSAGDAQFLLGYDSSYWWTTIGLLLATLSLLGLFRVKQTGPGSRVLRLFPGVLLVIGISLASIIRSGALAQPMASSPVVAGLDDIERVQFWIVLAFAMLLPSGIDVIQSMAVRGRHWFVHSLGPTIRLPGFCRFRWHLQSSGSRRAGRHAVRYALCAIATVAILLSNYPALDSSFGLTPIRGDTYAVPGYYSEITGLETSGALDTSHYRVLWLPYTSADLARQHWFSTFELNPPYEMSFFNPSVSSVTSLYSAICQYNNTAGIQDLLSMWGVHYIVVDWNESRQITPSIAPAPCVVSVSPVFTSFEATRGFIVRFMASLTGYRPILQSTNISVYTASVPSLAYIGLPSRGPNQINTTVPFVAMASRNLVPGGAPIDVRNWSYWPSASLASQTSVFGVPSLTLNLSSQDLTVAQQLFTVNSSDEYRLSFQVQKSDAYARARILWYENYTELQSGTQLRIDYFPPYLPPFSVASPTNYSGTSLPPDGASLATLQLLVSTSSVMDTQNLSAVFANVSLTTETWVLNNVTRILPASELCGGTMNAVSPIQVQISAVSCSGTFSLVLSTAFNSGWVAEIESKNGSSTPAADHVVGNYVFNTWTINLSRGDSIDIKYLPDAERTAQVLGVIVYVPVILAVSLLYRPLMRRIRRLL